MTSIKKKLEQHNRKTPKKQYQNRKKNERDDSNSDQGCKVVS